MTNLNPTSPSWPPSSSHGPSSPVHVGNECMSRRGWFEINLSLGHRVHGALRRFVLANASMEVGSLFGECWLLLLGGTARLFHLALFES